MAICLSPGGSTIYNSPHFSEQLMAATQDGVVVLSCGDGAWRENHRALAVHQRSALPRAVLIGNLRYFVTERRSVLARPIG